MNLNRTKSITILTNGSTVNNKSFYTKSSKSNYNAFMSKDFKNSLYWLNSKKKRFKLSENYKELNSYRNRFHP